MAELLCKNETSPSYLNVASETDRFTFVRQKTAFTNMNFKSAVFFPFIYLGVDT